MSDYANPDALVETDWLEEHLNVGAAPHLVFTGLRVPTDR